MVAIAMTREMGTLGKDVAQGIAESLNLNVVHSELVEHDLATRLGVQESTVHHYLEGNVDLPRIYSVSLIRYFVIKENDHETQTQRRIQT